MVVALAVFSSIVACANTFYSAYRVQRDLLLSNTLEANRVYAAKLADSATNFVKAAQQQLNVSADSLAQRALDGKSLDDEVNRLLRQTDFFNSVQIVDAKGRVRAVAPASLNIRGKLLNSTGARTALESKRPQISQPYVSAAGKFIINISQPILTREGHYLGYVGGSVYLQEKSILHTLLGEHYYRDGSYLYVVDQTGRILYHPDASRIGAVVRANPVVAAVTAGESGAKRVVNSKGVDMLAGFAPVPLAGWGIVAQRPTAATLAEMDQITLAVIRNTIPAAFLALVVIWYLALRVAEPLRQLARATRQKDAAATIQDIQTIRPWYFEAQQLKQAILDGLSALQERIGALNEAAATDPMTGLSNRRALSAKLRSWGVTGQPFAVIALDIDHFKRVNDNYGHDAGDRVICHIAKLMRECSRRGDFLCRSGGEEFLLLLPDCGAAEAMQIAERLRQRTEATPTPGVCAVTISLGLASWPASHGSMERVLALADAALYSAKQQGRNRIEVDVSLATQPRVAPTKSLATGRGPSEAGRT